MAEQGAKKGTSIRPPVGARNFGHGNGTRAIESRGAPTQSSVNAKVTCQARIAVVPAVPEARAQEPQGH
jgi:hypothetical protein